ncbi:MAG: hypothetical protein J7578_04425 [Chitinophagaceae bacterium]|nr:hypothetical protein [Chitinophagaceae bacterium]
MISLLLNFTSNGKECSAEVELEGIAHSWNAEVKVTGHPSIHQFHIKYWLGSFLLPVFESRDAAIFFEPLFQQIEERATEVLPGEFD